MVQVLDELLAKYETLPEKGQAAFAEHIDRATGGLKWVPNPGPQTEAYFSKADVLLFGGEPGGGKTQLGLGLAFNCHERSLICRRQYTDLGFIIDSAIEIHGSRDGYSGQPPPSLNHAGGVIDFGAAARVGDEHKRMGNPHDLIVFDEATQFVYSQIRFISAWNRSSKPGQRCRVVLATNPPLTPAGLWVLKMFAPWFTPGHPYAAKSGDIRWVCIDENDDEYWVDEAGEYEFVRPDGSKYTRHAESRSYIASGLEDNPSYNPDEYRKKLDALPAEIRKVLLGGFTQGFKDRAFQVIPTAWIMAAFERWKLNRKPAPDIPMTAVGVDPTGGGDDAMVIACRHDWHYLPLLEYAGHEFDKEKLGAEQAARIVAARRDRAVIGCDMGGGYGQAIFEKLQDNLERGEFLSIKGAEKAIGRTRDGQFGFINRRSELYWKFREALNPEQDFGSPIELPEDMELLADLTAVDYELTANGYKVTPKDAPGKDTDCVRSRLGRSPNKGDAVVNAWAVGDRMVPKGQKYSRGRSGTTTPGVNLGPRHRRIRR